MSDSLSFDRGAGYYDQTRSMPEPVARQGVRAILDLAGPAGHILDVGTGTGRIGVTLLKRGADLVGCDISARMLNRLQEKYASARLAQADASRLPFPDGWFGAVMTVHVIHLMSPWQEAVREFKRVLLPEGVYLNVRTYASLGGTLREQLRKHWRGWVEAHGARIYQPGVQELTRKKRYARLDASVTAPNRIEVEVGFVQRYTLFLNDQLVDISKPVTVVTNKHVSFEGMVTPTVETLLRQARARKDSRQLFTVQLAIQVSTPAP